MNNTNNTANVSARNVVVGDMVEHLGTFHRVTAAQIKHYPINREFVLEATLEGYGVVCIPTMNTVRVAR